MRLEVLKDLELESLRRPACLEGLRRGTLEA
jgi:hypothetical protein